MSDCSQLSLVVFLSHKHTQKKHTQLEIAQRKTIVFFLYFGRCVEESLTHKHSHYSRNFIHIWVALVGWLVGWLVGCYTDAYNILCKNFL